jgi:predicted Zn-ribbon and HTH transcriptional regulator
MWKLFGKTKETAVRRGDTHDALDAAMQAMKESEVDRPLPTLVCRDCGLKYFNTGTFLKGSRCPSCHPNG